MRNYQEIRSGPVQVTKLLIMLVLLLMTVGCGVIGIHEKYGQLFNFDNSLKIRPGMTQEQVTALLGEPYIIGQEQDGDMVLKYEWREVEGQSFLFGVFVIGEKRTVAVSGGEAKITFAPDTKTVRTVEYSIVGNANYDRLRGGRDGTAR